jgi:hypothetical protein
VLQDISANRVPILGFVITGIVVGSSATTPWQLEKNARAARHRPSSGREGRPAYMARSFTMPPYPSCRPRTTGDRRKESRASPVSRPRIELGGLSSHQAALALSRTSADGTAPHAPTPMPTRARRGLGNHRRRRAGGPPVRPAVRPERRE